MAFAGVSALYSLALGCMAGPQWEQRECPAQVQPGPSKPSIVPPTTPPYPLPQKEAGGFLHGAWKSDLF